VSWAGWVNMFDSVPCRFWKPTGPRKTRLHRPVIDNAKLIMQSLRGAGMFSRMFRLGPALATLLAVVCFSTAAFAQLDGGGGGGGGGGGAKDGSRTLPRPKSSGSGGWTTVGNVPSGADSPNDSDRCRTRALVRDVVPCSSCVYCVCITAEVASQH
jgi:hypothetical protein